MSDVFWRFFGYQTPAGGRQVQEWFDGLTDDERDEIQDTLAYLQKLPIHLWKKPDFFPLQDGLSEVRIKVAVLNKTLRIYGCFWPDNIRHSYTFLLGAEKKVSNPTHDIKEARKRKKKVEGKEVSVHEFKFG
jgi:hypothetical protein